jgi:hypothetical protein
MGAAAAVLLHQESMTTDYTPAPEKKVPLNMRVPASLRKKLEMLVRLWKVQAQANKHDPTNIDVTHVATELLKDGVALAFKKYGGFPEDEAATKDLEKAILDGVELADSSASPPAKKK